MHIDLKFKYDMENLGNIITRLGLGLLFIWGELEKLFQDFLGGVGLETMSSFLGNISFSFLGETGTYILAIWLAISELIAGLFILLNYKTTIAS